MTTVSQTVSHYGEVHKDALSVSRELILFFAAPFIGLAYIVVYAVVGITAAFCFGLKAFGVRCGVFKG